MSDPAPDRSHPPVFAIAAFWAFVLGGIAFGLVFVANWRALGARPSERPNGAPKGGMVGRGPVSVRVPVTISRPAPASNPVKPPQTTTGIAAVVQNVLPDWQGTDRINILLLGIDKRDNEPIA